MPLAQFSNPLEASSYFHPTANSAYGPLREKTVEIASLMGYDYDSLTEIGIDWSSDQDPNNHVTNTAYPRYASAGLMRLFESLASVIGHKAAEMLKGRGIGPVVKGYTMDLKRPAAYPDALIVGNRLSEIQPDRYFTTTTIWSLRQQAVVAECKGYIVFINYDNGRPANLIEAGEPYVALHAQIKAKVEKSNMLFAEWEKKNPPKKKPQL